MKYFDKVKLLIDRKEYNDEGIYKGSIGIIFDAEIRDNCFHVAFPGKELWVDITIPVQIKDLELVSSGNLSDEMILEGLPKNNPDWWCKVEDGFILNLKGERKNKTPYDYDS